MHSGKLTLAAAAALMVAAPAAHAASPVSDDEVKSLVERFGGESIRERERGHAERAHDLVSRALALEGTCTGEHGVGLHKMDFLVTEAGAGAIDMMRTIKRALDPENRMNPGKLVAI